jgi:hypothetical protein
MHSTLAPLLRTAAAAALLFTFVSEASARSVIARTEDDIRVPGVRIETSIPRISSIIAGGKLCYDSDGGVPNADQVGERLKLSSCYGMEGQAFLLENGVLYVGYDKRAQVVVDSKPEWIGCLPRTLSSKLRSYVLAACTAEDGKTGLDANFYDPQHAVLNGYGPPDALVAGRPLLVAPVTAERPAREMWEYVPGKKILRASGTNLCITPPLGDMTERAPLSLDDCDTPMMDVGGAAGLTDGRATVSFEQRTPKGREWYTPLPKWDDTMR